MVSLRSSGRTLTPVKGPRSFQVLAVLSILIVAADAAARTWSRTARAMRRRFQAAIGSAAPVDTVLVAPRVYDETLDTHGKELPLRGTTVPDATIIEGGRRGRVLSLNSGCTVERLRATDRTTRTTGA